MKINCIKSIFLCFVALSILFLSLPAFAETTLQVKCVDASGAPLKDVKVVTLPLKPPAKMKDKKSDAQGIAEFKLDDGAYRVFGRKEGFEPALYEFAVLKGSPVTATLKFAAGADKKLYFEDPAEEKKAQDLLMQGLQALKDNKFPAAEKSLADSVAIAPSNAEALYYLAVSRLQQQKYDEGIQTLDKTMEVASAWMTVPSPAPPGSPNPYEQVYKSAQNVKAKLPGIRAEEALRNKNYDQAVKEFSALAKANPNEPDYQANLAIALANLKKYDEALEALDKAIKLKPGVYDGTRSSILARKEAEELDKAQALLDQGNKLLQDGDAAGALKKFEESRPMVAPAKQAPIWRQIGRAQAKLNQPEAVDSFKKAIELAPADKAGEYRNAFAQYYLDQKKYDEALDTIIDPKSTEGPEKTLLGLAKTSMNKEPRLAKAALERVLKMSPDNLDAAFDLGQMYYMDKDNDKRAKELITKYIEKGQDAAKLENAKAMLVMINRRTK